MSFSLEPVRSILVSDTTQHMSGTYIILRNRLSHKPRINLGMLLNIPNTSTSIVSSSEPTTSTFPRRSRNRVRHIVGCLTHMIACNSRVQTTESDQTNLRMLLSGVFCAGLGAASALRRWQIRLPLARQCRFRYEVLR